MNSLRIITNESMSSMQHDSNNDESNYSSNVNSNDCLSDQLIVIVEFYDFETNSNEDYDDKKFV